jgi:hypothetical protein
MAENTSSVSKEISQRNSSTDVIAAGSFFTGPWEDVSNFTSVIVSAYASQNGLVYSEFSNDGVNLLEFKSYQTVSGISETNTTAIGDYKFYRTRFKNTGVSTLTYLNLVTTYDNGSVSDSDTNVVSSVLPDGASTEATQVVMSNTLYSIDEVLNGVSTIAKQEEIKESIDNLGLKSYNQEDILNLILEQLQEQTKILKKIYQ